MFHVLHAPKKKDGWNATVLENVIINLMGFLSFSLLVISDPVIDGRIRVVIDDLVQ